MLSSLRQVLITLGRVVDPLLETVITSFSSVTNHAFIISSFIIYTAKTTNYALNEREDNHLHSIGLMISSYMLIKTKSLGLKQNQTS